MHWTFRNCGLGNLRTAGFGISRNVGFGIISEYFGTSGIQDIIRRHMDSVNQNAYPSNGNDDQGQKLQKELQKDASEQIAKIQSATTIKMKIYQLREMQMKHTPLEFCLSQKKWAIPFFYG
nr:hypothetical protein [Tanacetum cinerariifolium]